MRLCVESTFAVEEAFFGRIRHLLRFFGKIKSPTLAPTTLWNELLFEAQIFAPTDSAKGIQAPYNVSSSTTRNYRLKFMLHLTSLYKFCEFVAFRFRELAIILIIYITFSVILDEYCPPLKYCH